MHETGMAQEIVDIITQTLEQHPGRCLKKATVIVGQMNPVVPELLSFAYDCIIENTPLKDSCLEIEIIPAKANCKTCGQEFTINDPVFLCPCCFSSNIYVTQGDELYLKTIEVD